jgi:hypothetical protein
MIDEEEAGENLESEPNGSGGPTQENNASDLRDARPA